MSSRAPEFIDPTDISKFDDDGIEKMLEQIRERRLRAYAIYEETLAQAKAVQDAKVRATLEKQLDMLKKNIDRVDKAIEALDDRVNKVRALRLQLDL